MPDCEAVPPEGGESFLLQGQRSTTLALADTLFRTLDATGMQRALLKIREELGQLPHMPKGLDDAEFKKREVLPCGWYALPLVELKVMAALGVLLEKGKEMLSYEERWECINVIDNERMVDARMKSYFKHVLGRRDPRIQQCWDQMVAMHVENRGAEGKIGQVCKEELTADMQTFISKITAFSNVGCAYNAVIDLAQRHEDVKSFGLVFSGKQAPAENVDKQQHIDMAKSVCEKLLMAVDLVFQTMQPHKTIVDTRLQKGVYKRPVNVKSMYTEGKDFKEDEKGEEYDPAVEQLDWLEVALDILSAYQVQSPQSLAEANNRLLLVQDCISLCKREQITAPNVNEEATATHVAAWSALWNKEVAVVKAKDAFVSGTPGHGLQDFIIKTQGLVQTQLVNMLQAQMAKCSPVSDAYGKAIRRLSAELPPQLSVLEQSATSVKSLIEAGARLEKGQSIGTLPQVTATLASYSKAGTDSPDFFAQLPTNVTGETFEKVKREWKDLLNDLIQRVKSVRDDMDTFKEEFNVVSTAIETWDFGETPYICAPCSNEVKMKTNKVERAVDMEDYLNTTVQQTLQECVGFVGTAEDETRELKETAKSMAAVTKAIKDAAGIYGTMLVARPIVQTPDEPSKIIIAKDYACKVVGVDFEQLPKVLQEKYNELVKPVAQGIGKTKGGGASSTTASTNASESGVSSANPPGKARKALQRMTG